MPQRHQIGFQHLQSENTTFYTLEDVRIEATLWCEKIGLGSDTITDTQATRLNPQQHVKTAELLLAHRHHRHGAPPGTPEPGDVSPLLCRGVSSLYCAYTPKSRNGCYGKCPEAAADTKSRPSTHAVGQAVHSHI